MSRRSAILAAGGLLVLLGGCTTVPVVVRGPGLPPDAEATVAEFREARPETVDFFEDAYGYAVFPRITRAALGFGGGSGTGVVVEAGHVVGGVKVTKFIHGVSFGGESYSEIIFFRDQQTLEAFKEGSVEFRGRAAAAAGTQGSSAEPAFSRGVAVFSMTRAGLMLDVSVAGASYKFTPSPGATDPEAE